MVAEPFETPKADSEAQFAAAFERILDGLERQANNFAAKVERENESGATVQREGNSAVQALKTNPERALHGQTAAVSEEESSTNHAPKADFAMLAMRPMDSPVAHLRAKSAAEEQDAEDAEPAQSAGESDSDDRSKITAALMHSKNIDHSSAVDRMLGEISKEFDSIISPAKRYNAISENNHEKLLERRRAAWAKYVQAAHKAELDRSGTNKIKVDRDSHKLERLRSQRRKVDSKLDDNQREEVRAERKLDDSKREEVRAERKNGHQSTHQVEMGGSNALEIKVDKESNKLERLRGQRSALKVENKQLRGLRKVLKSELHVGKEISELKAENKKLREENVALKNQLNDA